MPIENQNPEIPLPIIAYIDELEDERANFVTDAYLSQLFSEIHAIAPPPAMNSLIEQLLELQIDALVTDFNLSEATPLNYSGQDIVSAFLAIRSDFPCFIRTSFENAAFQSADDVNKVYSKNFAIELAAGRDIFQRIALQIDHHKRRIHSWQDELEHLLQLNSAERNAATIERIMDLDKKIEASLGQDMAIPERIKSQLFVNENALIEETENLIALMKQALAQ